LLSSTNSNRLADEKSPYLLQHADNPVNWQPWDDRAWEIARREDKPVFLSIGYSTCHWCHVMARESFSSEEIAGILNEHFVSIKVDREERPVIDKIYMEVCQAMTGQGGWPLSIFLTPQQKPFYAGTYFPPESRRGLPGFKRILLQIKDLWQEKREEINTSAEEITGKIKDLTREKVLPGKEGKKIFEEKRKEVVNQLAENLRKKFDYQAGGFGSAPKFPQTDHLNFLLAGARYQGDETAREMVRTTMDRMLAGGIYDQVAGGFFRYATDQNWEIPHFEKMLYDNALLIETLVGLYRLTGADKYRDIIDEIFGFLQREMKLPEGGYASALDAESSGTEGGFYLWTVEEIAEALDKKNRKQENLEAIKKYLNITESGNFQGKNHPRLSGEFTVRDEKIKSLLADLRKYRDREKEAPDRDYKILTAWNSLLVGALARAAALNGSEKYRQESGEIINFIRNNLYVDGRLFVRQARGEIAFQGNLDDYAFFLKAVLDYYRLAGEKEYLELALELATTLEEDFSSETGSLHYQSRQGEELLYNPTPGSSSSLPAGNAVAAEAYQRLALLTGDTFWHGRYREITGSFSSSLSRMPEAYSGLVRLLLLEEHRSLIEILLPESDREREIRSSLIPLLAEEEELLIVTEKNAADYQKLLSRIHQEKDSIKEFSARVCKFDRCIREFNSLEKLINELKSRDKSYK